MKPNSLFISLFLTTFLFSCGMPSPNESDKINSISNSLGTILPLISIILVTVILVIAFKNDSKKVDDKTNSAYEGKKRILGVCNQIAQKANIKPLLIRIIFIVATIALPILGILVYLLIFWIKNRKNIKIKNKITFSILGAILGIPLSYYFQSEMVKSKVGGIGGYIQNFGDIVDNSDLLGNVIISIIVFALVGGLIGYFIDENEAKKIK